MLKFMNKCHHQNPYTYISRDAQLLGQYSYKRYKRFDLYYNLFKPNSVLQISSCDLEITEPSLIPKIKIQLRLNEVIHT